MPHAASDASQLNSLYFSILISILYPASLYIWPDVLTSDRHHPRTILRNFLSVLLASLVSAQALLWFQQMYDPNYLPGNSVLHYINWKSYRTRWHFFCRCLALPMLHALVLFAVPIYIDIYQTYLKYFKFPWNSPSFVIKATCHVAKQLLELPVIRNLVVAPLTEEFIFRGVVLTILVPFWSSGTAILISSLLFGLMHSHHFLRSLYLTGTVSKREALSSLLQCSYTGLFGAYAGVAYLTSGHLVTPIVLHCFCNLNGLPNFADIVSNKCHFFLTVVGFSTWLFFLGSQYLAL